MCVVKIPEALAGRSDLGCWWRSSVADCKRVSRPCSGTAPPRPTCGCSLGTEEEKLM